MFYRVLAFALVVLIPALAPAQESRTIRVYTGEWPPYVEEADDHKGILSEILKRALARIDRQPEFLFVPFSIAKQKAEDQGIALTFPWFTTEDDEQDWYVSYRSLFSIKYVFFYNKLNDSRIAKGGQLRDDLDRIEKLDDLAAFRIGGVKGYNYRPAVTKMIGDPDTRSNDEFIAFQRLIDGEIDFLPASKRVGEHLLDRYFAESRHKIGTLSKFSVDRPIHVLASKDRPENGPLIEDLDEALEQMETSGVVASIVTRYDARRQFDEVVRLQGSDKFPIVTGFKTRKDSEGYLIPNGTRAIVVDWGDGFLKTGPVDVTSQMFTKSKVRLLDGPLKGHELFVNSLYITFE